MAHGRCLAVTLPRQGPSTIVRSKEPTLVSREPSRASHARWPAGAQTLKWHPANVGAYDHEIHPRRHSCRHTPRFEFDSGCFCTHEIHYGVPYDGTTDSILWFLNREIVTAKQFVKDNVPNVVPCPCDMLPEPSPVPDCESLRAPQAATDSTKARRNVFSRLRLSIRHAFSTQQSCLLLGLTF